MKKTNLSNVIYYTLIIAVCITVLAIVSIANAELKKESYKTSSTSNEEINAKIYTLEDLTIYVKAQVHFYEQSKAALSRAKAEKRKQQNKEENNITKNESKRFMDYRTITDTTSKQFSIQRNAVTNKEGLRIYQGRYCIAIGQGWGNKVGDKVTVILAGGRTQECIVADLKKDEDTDVTNKKALDGTTIEAIVDANAISEKTEMMGDISYTEGWYGCVKTIEKQ